MALVVGRALGAAAWAAGPVQRRLPLSVCGFAFAPAYATVAPAVAARVMAAQAALVTELAELGSMTGDRLRLDRTTILDPIADTLPEVETKQPALARKHRARWWARGAAAQPTQTIAHR